MKFISTKTYEHLASCCFRQWRAKSHCSFLHGYALTFKFTFGANKLDDNNWVVDFGGLATLKKSLEFWYDHTTVIAEDDPEYQTFLKMDSAGLCTLRMLPSTGCEAFARHGYLLAEIVIKEFFPHAKVLSCEVMEHTGNSAIYCRGQI